jgi:hypothetical protein
MKNLVITFLMSGLSLNKALLFSGVDSSLSINSIFRYIYSQILFFCYLLTPLKSNILRVRSNATTNIVTAHPNPALTQASFDHSPLIIPQILIIFHLRVEL